MARDGLKTLTQDLAQREADHQRWADDGGYIPEPSPAPANVVTAVARNPWVAVGIAVGLGFALGWLTGRR